MSSGDKNKIDSSQSPQKPNNELNTVQEPCIKADKISQLNPQNENQTPTLTEAEKTNHLGSDILESEHRPQATIDDGRKQNEVNSSVSEVSIPSAETQKDLQGDETNKVGSLPLIDDLGAMDEREQLVKSDLAHWNRLDPKAREQYVRHIYTTYSQMVNGFLHLGNQYLIKSNKAEVANSKWRIRLIIASGGLAIVNILLSIFSEGAPDSVQLNESPSVFETFWYSLSLTVYHVLDELPIIAAIYASILATFNTLEGHHKYSEKTIFNREVRDLFIDAGREMKMKWDTLVMPFGSTPQACLNATELYAEIIDKDKTLRLQTKQNHEDADGG